MAAPYWEMYRDTGGKYRWRLHASNGILVASSGESFSSKTALEIAILVAQNAAKGTKVVDKTAP